MHAFARQSLYATLVGLCVVAIVALAPLSSAAEDADEHREANQIENVEQSGDAHVADDEHTTGSAAHNAGHSNGHGAHVVPGLIWILPFVALLLCIALLPLFHKTEHWWENNLHRLYVSLTLGLIVCLYYLLRPFGFHADPGMPSLLAMLNHAVIAEYVPFIVLLFSLFTISGGINLKGDLPAHPKTNVAFLAIGAGLASFIGTTGAAMLLIRPLLQVNSERKYVTHTVIFFIFLVANIGGSLLPIGDPPLFLGYLRGVPFLWTFNLIIHWAICVVIVLAVYFVWDMIAYRKEAIKDIVLDEETRIPLKMTGKINILFLLGVVFAVALLVPGKELFGWVIPKHLYLREIVQLGLAGLSMLSTAKVIRKDNAFSFFAIGEVAALFIGIFITMQVPVEILTLKGAALGLSTEWHFFWATGLLSSFLDNAPTYVVFFTTATALPIPEGVETLSVLAGEAEISVPLLIAISCGSVFMGACTYIGNGPNFMVKSIAEQSGVKMPSFFGYMLYSGAILLPIFAIITLIFFR